ncbi:hypothetical protein, partial [Alteromonas sp. a30]|uniref:hypothetical protein n=1 Tax=Alteromonas sp. a30 TaxID=2730917 RepID=UPI00227E555B
AAFTQRIGAIEAHQHHRKRSIFQRAQWREKASFVDVLANQGAYTMPLTLSFNLQSLRFWELRSLYEMCLKRLFVCNRISGDHAVIVALLRKIEREIHSRLELGIRGNVKHQNDGQCLGG